MFEKGCAADFEPVGAQRALSSISVSQAKAVAALVGAGDCKELYEKLAAAFFGAGDAV
jgi:hypothetical protein